MECPYCYGSGRLVTECCDGSHGCSCKGGLVDVGDCQVCNGSGFVEEGNYNESANFDYLKSTGACFAGSGPDSGLFKGTNALHGRSLS